MDAASARIMDKLWQGTLPADDPVRLRGGLGSGLPCDGCDAVIASSEPEHEVEMPDGRTPAVPCRLHGAVAGVEAGDAEVVAPSCA
jgi:hypothetical protein